MSDGIADSGELPAAPAGDVRATAEVPTSGTYGADADQRMGLQSAIVLGQPKAVGTRRHRPAPKPTAGQPIAGSVVPVLRLQKSLTVKARAVDMPAGAIVSGGELNREGIVPARRLQVRDGAIFLESDGAQYQETVHPADRPAVATLPQ